MFDAAKILSFGVRGAALGMYLVAFNHQMILFSGQLSMDCLVTSLNCFVIAAWMRKDEKTVIFLCALVTFLRLNYGIVCLVIGAHMIFCQKPMQMTRASWIFHLIRMGLFALVSVGLAFFVVDSWWYGQPTLSLFNFFHFNLLNPGSQYFGSMPFAFFLDKMMLDNTAILTTTALLVRASPFFSLVHLTQKSAGGVPEQFAAVCNTQCGDVCVALSL